jgi:hypothetical protein
MSNARFASLLSATTVALFLVACGGTSSSQTTFGVGPSESAPDTTIPTVPGFRGRVAVAAINSSDAHPGREKSWVSPDVKDVHELVFISDNRSEDVYIFKMPGFVLKGTLTGFQFPSGMCSDASGNVWITDFKASEVFQYSRTGKLLKTLQAYEAWGCAVNKSNGDVAVTSYYAPTGSHCEVTVYPNGSGSGTSYTIAEMSRCFYAAYDTNGNLFFDGEGETEQNTVVEELPTGSGSPHVLSLYDGTIRFPGGIEWNSRTGHLLVVDQQCDNGARSCLDVIALLSASAGKMIRFIPLNNSYGSQCTVYQGTIDPSSKSYVGPCIEGGSGYPGIAAVWALAKGGTPTEYTSRAWRPIGSAISTK